MQYNIRCGFSISHLNYAYHYAFTRAYRHDLHHLIDFLEYYFLIYGQSISFHKSIVGTRCSPLMISRITITLGYVRKHLPIIYILGLLFTRGISGVRYFRLGLIG